MNTMLMQEAPAATRAFQRVVAQVSTLIPSDFPPDDKYWEPTYEPHDAFMDAVRMCEKHDTEENRNLVRFTAKRWEDSWREAVALWREDRRWA